ncbi:hypothetical protein [Limosilactobacillus gastricus]|uniref:hypothetical protein n=1 Tax=Limosilactobacillus gastricus TaxID=227942 RepID=UPI0026EE1B8E|nr:hypothetical protein [Limosilactobacillus gastricus]
MNDLQVNQFSYNFDNGAVTSAQVGLYGSDTTDGEYINTSIRVKQSDLPEGKSFMEVAMSDMVTIARKKLAADTAFKDTTTQAQ